MTDSNFRPADFDLSITEICDNIKSFLSKHAANRSMMPIDGYEFNVLNMSDIVVPESSINFLKDGAIQFNGSAVITKKDKASCIRTGGNSVTFHGVAFFVKDQEKDYYLRKICIDQLKQPNK